MIGLGEDELFVKGGVACANLFGGIEENGELDDGCGLHGLIGVKARVLTGAQIFSIDGEVAVMLGGDGFELGFESCVRWNATPL